MANVPLLQHAMSLVESAVAKGEWDQEFYRTNRVIRNDGSCGTTLCFAGWTVIAAGAEFASDNPMHTGYGCVIDDLGGVTDIPIWAANALDLSFFEAGELFSASNTLEDLRAIVERHCAVEAVA